MTQLLTAREVAGREWAYQLREWAAQLDAQGQPGRAREVARLAAETERETALVHAAILERSHERGGRAAP